MGCNTSSPSSAINANQLPKLDAGKQWTLNVLVIGRAGVGKSSFLNSLTRALGGQGSFKTGGGVRSVTQNPESIKMTLPAQGTPVQVTLTDVPGFGDVDVSDANIVDDLKKHLAQKGTRSLHAMVFVEKWSEMRVLQRQVDFMQLLQNAFGPGIFDILYVVLTRFDFPRKREIQAFQEAHESLDRRFRQFNRGFQDTFEKTICQDSFIALDTVAVNTEVADDMNMTRSKKFGMEQLQKMQISLVQRLQKGKELLINSPPEPDVISFLHPKVLGVLGRKVDKMNIGAEGHDLADVYWSNTSEAWKLTADFTSLLKLMRKELNIEQRLLLSVPDSSEVIWVPCDASTPVCQIASTSKETAELHADGRTLRSDCLRGWRLTKGDEWTIGFTLPKVTIRLPGAPPDGKCIMGVTLMAKREFAIQPGSIIAAQASLQRKYEEFLAMDPYDWTVDKVEVGGSGAVDAGWLSSVTSMWTQPAKTHPARTHHPPEQFARPCPSPSTLSTKSPESETGSVAQRWEAHEEDEIPTPPPQPAHAAPTQDQYGYSHAGDAHSCRGAANGYSQGLNQHTFSSGGHMCGQVCPRDGRTAVDGRGYGSAGPFGVNGNRGSQHHFGAGDVRGRGVADNLYGTQCNASLQYVHNNGIAPHGFSSRTGHQTAYDSGAAFGNGSTRGVGRVFHGVDDAKSRQLQEDVQRDILKRRQI